MPDIGLIELLVIGILLFLVVGPERMPEALKQATDALRTVRGWLSNVTSALTEQADALKTPIEQTKNDASKHLAVDLAPINDELGAALKNFKDAIDEKPSENAPTLAEDTTKK